MSRTDPLWAERKSPFLPLGETASRKLSHNTILAGLEKTISLAYKVAGKDEELGLLHSLLSHETRAFAASWDALQNILVKDI